MDIALVNVECRIAGEVFRLVEVFRAPCSGFIGLCELLQVEILPLHGIGDDGLHPLRLAHLERSDLCRGLRDADDALGVL